MKKIAKTELCIECQEKQVHIKKHGLCKRCYGKFQRKSQNDKGLPKATVTQVKHQHISEINFIGAYFTHKNWVHYPAAFNLGDAGRYTPDFYDGERNVFIEVVGTRQAYHQNKEKYELFIQKFPLLAFEVRDSNGEIYESKKVKVQGWGKWAGNEE